MSLRQLGERLKITAQSVNEIENREKNGTVSLNVLRQVGSSLDMKLVYGFIPKTGSLEQMIEKRALEIARDIVQRTSASMTLEDQGNSKTRLNKAILLFSALGHPKKYLFCFLCFLVAFYYPAFFFTVIIEAISIFINSFSNRTSALCVSFSRHSLAN